MVWTRMACPVSPIALDPPRDKNLDDRTPPVDTAPEARRLTTRRAAACIRRHAPVIHADAARGGEVHLKVGHGRRTRRREPCLLSVRSRPSGPNSATPSWPVFRRTTSVAGVLG